MSSDGSSTADVGETTSQTATTTEPPTSTSTTNDPSASASEDTADACEPQVFAGIEVPLQPVNLFIVVLQSADEASLEVVQAGLLDGLLGPDAEDLRLVFADDGTATPPVSAKHLCSSCMDQSCDSAVRHASMGVSFIGDLLGAALGGAFACVLHPGDAMPRGRILIVAGPLAADVTEMDVETLDLLLSEPDSNADLICSGCTLGGDSEAEKLIAAHGGNVGDLDDPMQVTETLLRAGLAPPRCVWPIVEEVGPPLGLDDLTLRIDACLDEPCEFELEQVTGAGACDPTPAIPQFYVTPDLFAPGVSAVTLCAHACDGYRRAAHAFMRVEHVYNCPE